MIELTLSEEPFPAKLPLEITVTLVNPAISPVESENVWQLMSFTSLS